MSTYVYKAKRGPVEAVSGEVEADSEVQAVSKIEGMGLVPVSVVEKSAGERVSGLAGSTRKPAYPHTRIPAHNIDTFTRQMSSLIRAGIPILKALVLITEQTENIALARVVDGLKKKVEEGKMLSEALGAHPALFNNLYISMVRSGEKGGVIDEVLVKLVEYRQRQEEIKRKIQTALAYPVLMMVVGAGTVFVMLTYFMPKLTALFRTMKQALPLPTRILIAISSFMSSYWYLFIIGGIFLVAIFARIRKGSKKKFIFDMFLLRVPVINKFIKDSEIAKFARTLSMLLKNGISIHEGLKLAADTLDNEALKAGLAGVSGEIINQGSSLSTGLRKSRLFPKFAVNMIAVGEEGGKLDESLGEVAMTYERDVDQAVKIMSALLEPLLILAVGTVVGFIVFAMLLPIFNIGAVAR